MGATSDRPAVKEVLILCNACAELAASGHMVRWLKAKLGPQGLSEDDVAILMAPTLREARTEKLHRAMRMECEHCQALIYVAPSSQWLLDMKAALLQKPESGLRRIRFRGLLEGRGRVRGRHLG